MAKPSFIDLPGCEPIDILYEDRSVLAIDKPRGWMLVPHSWRQTNWNLQAAIDSSIRADDYWAKSRNLKFLRHVHRLDEIGIVCLELDGPRDEVAAAVKWLEKSGVKVEPVEIGVIAG